MNEVVTSGGTVNGIPSDQSNHVNDPIGSDTSNSSSSTHAVQNRQVNGTEASQPTDGTSPNFRASSSATDPSSSTHYLAPTQEFSILDDLRLNLGSFVVNLTPTQISTILTRFTVRLHTLNETTTTGTGIFVLGICLSYALYTYLREVEPPVAWRQRRVVLNSCRADWERLWGERTNDVVANDGGTIDKDADDQDDTDTFNSSLSSVPFISSSLSLNHSPLPTPPSRSPLTPSDFRSTPSPPTIPIDLSLSGSTLNGSDTPSFVGPSFRPTPTRFMIDDVADMSKEDADWSEEIENMHAKLEGEDEDIDGLDELERAGGDGCAGDGEGEGEGEGGARG